MIRLITFALIACLSACLSACSTNGVREEYSADGKITAREYKGGDANYAQYVSAASQSRPSIDVSACNGDATCVVAVAGFAALGQSNGQRIAPPTPKRTGWDYLIQGLGVVMPGVSAGYSAYNGRKMAESQNQMIGAMVGDLTAAASAVAQSGPTVTISDSYNDSSDNSQHGDTITDSYNAGDGSAIGDGNELINGDNAGNSGNIGEGNRQNSDGPFDDHSCDAAEVGCDGTITLPPAPIDPGT